MGLSAEDEKRIREYAASFEGQCVVAGGVIKCNLLKLELPNLQRKLETARAALDWIKCYLPPSIYAPYRQIHDKLEEALKAIE